MLARGSHPLRAPSQSRNAVAACGGAASSCSRQPERGGRVRGQSIGFAAASQPNSRRLGGRGNRGLEGHG
jgi:hypothetical protein